MAKDNPMNPHTTNDAQVERTVAPPVAKAKVVQAGSHEEDDPNKKAYHTARVRVYGESSTFVAPVLTALAGDAHVPPVGSDVAVMYGPNEKPWILGYWYAVNEDREPPNYQPGERVIGSPLSDSYIKFDANGDVNFQPQDGSTVSFGTNVEGCGTFMGSDQVIPTDDQFHRLQFDTVRYDPTGIFDVDNYEATIQEDGLYNLTALAKMAQAGANVSVEIAININGTQVVSAEREATPASPVSPNCQATRYLTEGDVVFAEFRIASGNTDTLRGGDEESEFDITRLGSLGPTNIQAGEYTDEKAQDAVASLLQGGAGVTLTYDDPNDTLTIDSDGASYSDEDAQDAVGSILSSQFTYDDAGNAINMDPHEGDADAHHTRYSDEEAEDAIAALLAGGTNISLSYDDANDTLTIDTSALNDEEVQDTVSTLLTGGTGVSLNYDDANDTLTINGFSGSHSDLTNIASDDHHTKTTSQNDLTDFSSDAQNIHVQSTEPSNPQENDIWIDTS